MEPPVRPDESDCCNSGCNPCILDVYEEQLKKFEQKRLSLSKTYVNCISPISYAVFKLVNVEKQSEETSLYTFKYLRPLRGEKVDNGLSLQFEPGQHFLLKTKFRGEEFTRAYTPISMEHDDPLQFTVLIKLYDYGKMSRFLKRIRLGTETLWRGPYGEFTINYNCKYLFLLAQGTGIAPIYGIIHNIINNAECYIFLKLFFCCKDYDNIHLRDQLYTLSSNWNFNYEIFLSNSENICIKYNETIHKKKVEFNDIQTYLLDKNENVDILICGSETFAECIKNYILECKVKEENIFIF